MNPSFNLSIGKNWIVLLGIVFLGILPVAAVAQDDTDLPNELGTAMGVHKLSVLSSQALGFELFEYFYLKKLAKGNSDQPAGAEQTIAIDGKLVTTDGTVYNFEKASVTRRSSGEYEGIHFSTVRVNGIRYSFEGSYLEEKVQERKGGNYTRIRGVLTKDDNGVLTRSSSLPFYEYAEM